MRDIVNVLKQHKILTIILIVAFLLIGLFAVLYYNNKKQMEEMVTELNTEKMELTKEYEELALDFSFQTDIDSINNLLQHERERIEQLIEEIKTIKATNASKIREYKKELTTLRKVLKNYIFQIDSLNRRNEQLTKENKEYQQKFTHIKSSMKKLEKQKETLEEKVDIASKLELKNIIAKGLTGKNKITKKTSRVAKIRVCFTIKKNITAPAGEKTVYLRIERPDKSLLMQSLDNKFKYEGSDINYSSKRVIEYEGKDLDVCIYYKVDEGELMKGEYIADIFIDGKNVGTGTFELK
jgi:myosin heavy subunit